MHLEWALRCDFGADFTPFSHFTVIFFAAKEPSESTVIGSGISLDGGILFEAKEIDTKNQEWRVAHEKKQQRERRQQIHKVTEV